MRQTEFAVVGGGPAGLSAAIEAARHGVDVLLMDENARPGGQLFKPWFLRALPRLKWWGIWPKKQRA